MNDSAMEKKKDQILIARVTAPIKSSLSQLAQGDGLSMAEYIARLIEREAKKRLRKERTNTGND